MNRLLVALFILPVLAYIGYKLWVLFLHMRRSITYAMSPEKQNGQE